MEKIELNFVAERLTKNTVRYAEQTNGKPLVIGVLYVQKHASTPEKIKVTIEAVG